MELKGMLLVLQILLTGCTPVLCDMFSGGVFKYISNGGQAAYCRVFQCCDEVDKDTAVTDLKAELDDRLYGQHLVKKGVISHIQGHLRTPHPPKALALSFHGPTGTGKNHVSRIIAEKLYRNGMKSDNVRLISATKEFPHREYFPSYKDYLREVIEKQVRKCGQSLFIFDEIDKMPANLIDTITPYLDYHEQLGGIDYRRAIFIFLSNTGGTAITSYVLQQWKEGKHREDISLAEPERILAKAAINSESEAGLWHGELISKHLVTAFLPFLPLERKYVRQCIRDALVTRRYYPSHEAVQTEVVDKVMDELTFYPEDEQLFSVTGCKRVAEKVDYVRYS